MNRRDSLALLATLPLTACTTVRATNTHPPLLPKRLSPGANIALITPAGPINQARLDRSLQAITGLGFTPKPGTGVLAQNGYNAGTIEQRLADLHAAFSDPTIDAVWAIRGGYGTTQLLPYLDHDLIRRNPKLLIGYSDLTGLLNAIYQRTGLVGLHGPVASSTWDDFATSNFLAVAAKSDIPHQILALPGGKTITPGTATGQLVGGNLTLTAALCGTPDQLNVRGKIVFLEDVGEAPYRIDRMLVQLDQSVNLRSAAGIALGDFVDCEGAGSNTLPLEQTLRNRLGDLGIPVYLGLPFGHGEFNCTLPIGRRAGLDATNGRLTLLEAAVR